jgi:hypothetical protein
MSVGRRIDVPSDAAREFSASFDTAAKVVSCVAIGILLVGAMASRSLIAGAFALLVLAGAYAYSPRGYTVGYGGVTVRRLVGDVTFSLDGLLEARPSNGDDMRGCVRLWGNGGLFGYYGLFRTSGLGRCTWYVTDRKRAVVLVTDRKTALFSPDDTEGFLSAIRFESPGLPDRGDLPQPGAPTKFASGWRTGFTGAAIGLLLLAFVAAALFYSPGEPDYTLSPSVLEIHDRFYPVTVEASEVDTGRIRVVDLDEEPNWRTVLRTNGFGNLRYQSGWFRTAGGQKIRMYRAGGRRLVLLPPKGVSDPVLIQVKDPEAFIAELRRAWGGSR